MNLHGKTWVAGKPDVRPSSSMQEVDEDCGSATSKYPIHDGAASKSSAQRIV